MRWLSMVMKVDLPMTSPGMTRDPAKDAVAFIGQLKNNEDKLIDQVKLLTKKDKSYCCRVFSTNVGGWTPFHACVMRGSLKLIKMAYKTGVSSNLEMGDCEDLPYKNCSPLHLAAHRGEISIIQFFLQHGSIVTKRDGSDHTPLYYAAKAENVLAVKKLIKYGGDTSELTPNQRRAYYNLTETRSSALLCLPSRSGMVRSRPGSMKIPRDR